MKVKIQQENGLYYLAHATTGDRLEGMHAASYNKAARLARRLSYPIAPRGIERHFFLPDTRAPLTRVECSSGLVFWLDGHCTAATVKAAANDRGTFSHLTPCRAAGMRSTYSGQF